MSTENKNSHQKGLNFIEFDPYNRIDFNMKNKANIKDALKEALNFLSTHHVDCVNLYTEDYLFKLNDEDANIDAIFKKYLEEKPKKSKAL
jgi:hypothetical protein